MTGITVSKTGISARCDSSLTQTFPDANGSDDIYRDIDIGTLSFGVESRDESIYSLIFIVFACGEALCIQYLEVVSTI